MIFGVDGWVGFECKAERHANVGLTCGFGTPCFPPCQDVDGDGYCSDDQRDDDFCRETHRGGVAVKVMYGRASRCSWKNGDDNARDYSEAVCFVDRMI